MSVDSRVDLYVGVNVGIFGLVLPDKFVGAAAGEEASAAVSLVLKHYSFPTLNFTFSASGRLNPKGSDELKIATTLEEIEMRVKLHALDAKGMLLDDPAALAVLGLYPDDTTATTHESPLQFAPNLAGLAGALPGVGTALSGVISALGVTVPRLIPQRFPITDKAFYAGPCEFGWYARSDQEKQKEGLRYGASVLQVSRLVAAIRADITVATDWRKDVTPQMLKLSSTIAINHPELPKSPQLVDLQSPESLPLTISRDDVMSLLDVSSAELDALIDSGELKAFGSGRRRVSKGSVLRLLGLSQEEHK